MPRWLAAGSVLLLLLALLAGLGAGLGDCAHAFTTHLGDEGWTNQRVELLGQELPVEDLQNWVENQQSQWMFQALAMAAGLVLMLALSTLGLMETAYVRRWSRRYELARLHGLFSRFGADMRRYLLVRTLLGLITGSVVTLGCWLLGIRLPLVWGVSNFLLNYLPTVGSVLGVIPPVLFTLADTGDPRQAVVALAVVGGAQLALGNWVDPLLQGKYLQMSPTAVLLGVTFWGWLWGPLGAFAGVPLMLFIGRACQMAQATQPLSKLILRSNTGPEFMGPKRNAVQKHGDQR
jgi:predicted PurR-regulated permease PerM